MTRPKYETPEEREREAEVRQACETAWSCELKKLASYEKLDYAAVRDEKPVAFVEIKCRNHKFGKFPTLMFGTTKIKQALFYSYAFGLDTLLVVRDGEGACFFTKIEPSKVELRYGGRTTNTRDPDDVSMVCHIATEHFSRLR